jgi:hypothetical protein
MLFSTLRGFGNKELGFDNIEYLRPKIEIVIDNLEKLSKNKQLDT